MSIFVPLRWLILTFVVSVLFLRVVEVHAQTDTKGLADASLEDLTNIKVYSASKRVQNTSDAPSSVTVITADDIQKFGYRTLADILRSVPGFYITYDRNYSFVGVRGFGRLGDWNSRVLLLVDGHRINNNIFGQATVGDEFPVDVDMFDRVEIVRGPSSSLYGDNAFFAVINVITRNGQQLRGWELSFEPASFGSYRGRASYGGTYKGMEMVLSGTVYDSAGQTLFFPEFDSPATNNGITRNTDDDENEHVLATIRYKGFTLQGVFGHREKGTPIAYFGTVFNDPRTRNFDDTQYFDLAYQHNLTETWKLDARTSYDQYRLDAPLATASGLSVGVDEFSSRGNWWTTNVRLSRTFWEKHEVTFGIEARDNLREDQGDFTSATNTFEQDLNSEWNWGLYAQEDYEITKKLSLSFGVRHDRYPRGVVVDTISGQPPVPTFLSSFGGTTNPRFGVIYHPQQKTTFKFLYGSAFRAPDVFETTPDLGDQVGDNVDLLPETIKTFEVVAEHAFNPNFKLIASVFHNRVNNLITLNPDSGTGLLVYTNSESVHATGTEIEFSGRTERGIQARASVSFTDSDSNGPSGHELDNSPAQMAKINISAPLAGKWLFGGLEGQYLGPRFTLTGNSVGAYQVFNATLFGHALGKHMDLSGSLYNLLNKKYADPGRPEDPEDTIQQDGRSFRIKITARF